MSQPADPDPRILTPSEDEPMVVVKSSWSGNGAAFHTTECRNVVQMRSTREVKQSVAEWKGYHECEVCITEGEYNDDPEREAQESNGDHVHPSPTPAECAAFRQALVDGATPGQIAGETDWGRTAVYTHARGDCDHADPVAHPPVAYGWHVAPDADDSGHDSRGHSRVDAATCLAIRRRLAAGEKRKAVADALDLSKSNLSQHATGACGHAHESGHPPVAHGWHEVDA